MCLYKLCCARCFADTFKSVCTNLVAINVLQYFLVALGLWRRKLWLNFQSGKTFSPSYLSFETFWTCVCFSNFHSGFVIPHCVPISSAFLFCTLNFISILYTRVAWWYISLPKSQYWYILEVIGMESFGIFYGNLMKFLWSFWNILVILVYCSLFGIF